MGWIEIIRKLQSESLNAAELQAVLLEVMRYIEPLQDVARRSDFQQLITYMESLAKAQEQTEKRVADLAEAVRGTEKCLESLALAQKRTEERVEELAQAQKRTEERLEELTAKVMELSEAQRRTERRVEELAQAQKRTEDALLKLTRRVDMIEERLEGISNSVGYSLENAAFKALPGLLQDRYGIEVQGRLLRRYVGDRQVNIWGRGRRNGRDVVIIGESKVRPSRKEVDRFLKIAHHLAAQEGWKEVVHVFVAHDIPPVVEQYLEERGILPFWSYEF